MRAPLESCGVRTPPFCPHLTFSKFSPTEVQVSTSELGLGGAVPFSPGRFSEFHAYISQTFLRFLLCARDPLRLRREIKRSPASRSLQSGFGVGGECRITKKPRRFAPSQRRSDSEGRKSGVTEDFPEGCCERRVRLLSPQPPESAGHGQLCTSQSVSLREAPGCRSNGKNPQLAKRTDSASGCDKGEIR